MTEIIDYPNYLIYEDGRVQNKKTKRFLKPQTDTAGYLNIIVSKNNKKKHFSIARLVGLYYIPNPELKQEIDHINRDKKDNRIENLRWATRCENNINRSNNKNNTSGYRHISPIKYGYLIALERKKLRYSKFVKELDDAIIQRDLMLSMWS